MSRLPRKSVVPNERPKASPGARKLRAAVEGEGESARTRILKVAADLFSSHGYVGTTMAQIADASGIRSPSLYYHFADKAGVLEAIAELTLESALSESAELLQQTTESPAKRLYSLVHVMVLRLSQSEYQLYCMFDPVFHTEEFRLVNGKLIAWLKDMESLIRDGIKRGEFERQDTKLAAEAVRGLIETGIRKHSAYSKVSPKTVADYVASFVIKGLTTKHPDLDALIG
jgi:AcrR family transcriptional regulator